MYDKEHRRNITKQKWTSVLPTNKYWKYIQVEVLELISFGSEIISTDHSLWNCGIQSWKFQFWTALIQRSSARWSALKQRWSALVFSTYSETTVITAKHSKIDEKALFRSDLLCAFNPGILKSAVFWFTSLIRSWWFDWQLKW